MGHSVGDAAARSVKKSEATKAAERTPDQILAGIRKNLDARLAVTPLDVRFLLAQYDEVKALMIQNTQLLQQATDGLLTADEIIKDLTAKNEEFRRVYEAENRTATLQVDRVLGEEVKVTAVAETL